MEKRKSFATFKIQWLLMFMLLSACVDTINFDIPAAEEFTVIEGMITTDPGPYTVTVSEGLSLSADSAYRIPIEHANVKLYDDGGNVEDLTETSEGVYTTGGAIVGQVGHAYHIRVATNDGRIFESEPDTINPVGEVEAIRYEYEARTEEKPYGNVAADVYKIFVDSYAGSKDENFVRWKFTGIYKVVTNPELHAILPQGSTWLKDPLPCSGYVVAPALGGGILVQERECTCCTCWVHEFEEKPQLSDEQLISGDEFKNIKVGEVPINRNSFSYKYQIVVEQMSLSRESFEFFKLIRAQKEGASSLFQPPSGEIRGNITAENPSDRVVGIFWGTSINRKTLFLTRDNLPYVLAPADFVPTACYYYYRNASLTKPDGWE